MSRATTLQTLARDKTALKSTVLANPGIGVSLKCRVAGLRDGCAADRSLAPRQRLQVLQTGPIDSHRWPHPLVMDMQC